MLSGTYKEAPGSDTRFVYNVGNIQSVATSTCQADSGLFEVNFHDERYLPFEGTGVLGTWLLELPDILPQFDYNTIRDVILHIRYTAREGGSTLRTPVEQGQVDALNSLVHDAAEKHNGLFQAYLLAQQFPQEWYQLLSAKKTTLTITEAHLPFFTKNRSPIIMEVIWFARLEADPFPASFTIFVAGDITGTILAADSDSKGTYIGTSSILVTLGTAFDVMVQDSSHLKELVALIRYEIA
jgi:hypothetical protein